MNSKILYLTLLLLCFRPALGAAQGAHHLFVAPTNTLSLDWVLGQVLANNPSLKAAEGNWKALRERVPQERAWADPRADLDVKTARFVSLPANSMTDQRLTAEQTLPLAGKNRLRARAASAEASAGAEEYRQRRLDLLAKAEASYFRLVNAYGQWEVNRQSARFLQQIVEASRDKLESGQETQANVLAAETDLAKLDESAFDFERQIADEQSALNTLMHQPPASPLGRPAPQLFTTIDLPFDLVAAAALAHRPGLLAAAKNIEAAQAQLEAARRSWIPEPSVRLEASRYNGASLPVDDLMAGISFNLPWFNHDKYAAAIRENRERLATAQYDLQSLQAETAALVRDQLTKIATFRHHYELFRDKVAPLARQSIAASRSSYESGKAGLWQLLDAQQRAQETESMLIQHLTDYQIALAELAALVGAPLSEISAAPASSTRVNP